MDTSAVQTHESYALKFSQSGSIHHFIQWLRWLRCSNLFHIGIEIAEKYLDVFSDNPDFLLETSLCYFYADHYQKSFDCLDKILRLSHSNELIRQRVISNMSFCIPHIQDNYKTAPNFYTPPKNINLITFTITTCKRLDLFIQTMESFIVNCADHHLIDRWICIDDNSSESDRDQMQFRFPFFEFIWKTPDEKGHAKSMNMLWQSVKTPFIFHLEDDWKIIAKRPYMRLCLQVLEKDDEYGQCLVNQNYAETADDIDIEGGIRRCVDSVWFIEHRYDEHPSIIEKSCAYWPHFSLRVGMTRRSIYEQIGIFNETAPHFEMEYAYRYVAENYKTAFLEGISALHIGRLTSERQSTKDNAYTLNGEPQFVSPVSAVPEKKILEFHVINLDRRPDRLDLFDGRVNRKFAYSRYKAVDGYSLKPTRCLEQLFDGNDFNLRCGMVGCALSHLDLWCRLVAKGDNNVIDAYVILEDDIEMVENFGAHCQKLADNTENWDLIILGHHSKLTEKCFPKNPISTPIGYKLGTDESFQISYGGTGGYIISQSGAKKMLQYIHDKKMVKGIDTMIQLACDSLDIFYIYPHLIRSNCVVFGKNCDDVDTDIQRDYSSLTRPIKERLADERAYFENHGIDVCEYPTIPSILTQKAISIIPFTENLPDTNNIQFHYAIDQTYVVIIPVAFRKYTFEFQMMKNGKYSIQHLL